MDQADDQTSENVSCLEEGKPKEEEVNREMGDMSESKEKKSDSPQKEDYNDFLKKLEEQESPELKISFCLQFMEQAISEGKTPSFKNFWDARKICLSLFKEKNLSFAVRSHLWNKYVEFSKEAHRLKEVLDEQSSFAAEQIDLAIKALEEDIAKLDDTESQAPEVAFDSLPGSLEPKIDDYQNLQKELSLLNAFAARVNALRKELIKTEMRIRFKNKFFQRLSSAGDKIFPRRKDLIKEVSLHFMKDVDEFIEEHFSSNNFKQPLYSLREEIKALQGFAKILTLNTQAFNQTRMKLSECWDKIKKIEKDRKKEKAKIKASFKENADAVEAKVKELENRFQSGELDDHQASEQIKEASQFMRQYQLSRNDVKLFKDRLNKIRNEISEKATAAEQERLKREKEQQEEVSRKGMLFIDDLQKLIDELENRPLEEVQIEADKLSQEMNSLKAPKSLQHDFDKLHQNLQDRVAEQKIKNLPQNEQEAYDQLNILLADCKKRRKEVKDKLESYRRAHGSSGLDMEQALKQRELLEHEKERLEKVDDEIIHIKSKMKELES